MPISSNKSNLKVVTNIGGNLYEDEEVTNNYYQHHMQKSKQRPAGSHPMDMKTFGHPQQEEFEMPPEMERAIADDLTDKGVAPKPKRTRKKKTTTSD